MKLGSQRKLSAQLLDVGKRKVWFDPHRLAAVKEAITRLDIQQLVHKRIIQRRPELGTSRVRARKRMVQRRKGRQRGEGTRKGSRFARLTKKETRKYLVRSQRSFIRELKVKGLIGPSVYRDLYHKIHGGYFRNKRHIKLFLTEHRLFQMEKKV